MDKAALSNYRSRKMRIEKLKEDNEELKSKDIPVVAGKVKSSMKSFSYIKCHETVQMNQKVIDFIDDIKNPTERSIFEYYYVDGTERVTQKEVASKLNIEDRCRITKILNKYI